MSDQNDQGARAQSGGPSLRCPGCAFMVPLPAETCTRCGTSLRTGTPAADSYHDDGSPKVKIILGLGLFVVIIVLAVVILGGFLNKPQPAPLPTPTATDVNADIGEALDAFHGLSDHSIGQQPSIIIDRSRNTADKVEDKQRQRDELFKEIQ